MSNYDTSASATWASYSTPFRPFKSLKLAELKVKKVAEEKEVPKEKIFLFDSKDLDI